MCGIIIEVCQLIVENFWQEYVAKFWPDTEEKLQELMELMDSEFHFTSAYGAIDGSRIPIHCPPGGAEAAKGYHNFKTFYSVVLMTSCLKLVFPEYPSSEHSSSLATSNSPSIT